MKTDSDSQTCSNSRRDFLKKSLATSVIAGQPALLTGLIRAQGGGGEGPMAFFESTEIWESTEPLQHSEWVYKVFVKFDSYVDRENPEPDPAAKSGSIHGGKLYCILRNCDGFTKTVSFPVQTGGYDGSVYLDQSQNSDTGFPQGTFTVKRAQKGTGTIPQGHSTNLTIRNHGRDDMLVHDPIRDVGSSGCIVITAGFNKWSALMGRPRCKKETPCSSKPYPDPVEIVVYYADKFRPNFKWTPMENVSPPHNDPAKRPLPYPPVYTMPVPLGLPAPIVPHEQF